MQRLNLAAIAAVAVALWSGAAWGQSYSLPDAPVAPVRSSIDQNGVDVISGSYNFSQTLVSIGTPEAGALGRTRIGADNTDPYAGIVKISGSFATVTMGAQTEMFAYNGSVFTPIEPRGNSLVLSGGIYTYTLGDGTVIEYATSLSGGGLSNTDPAARLQTVKYVGGETVTVHYKQSAYQWVGSIQLRFWRIQSVTNNHGYQLKYGYALSAIGSIGDIPGWTNITSQVALNNAVDYCNPTADSCSYSQTWPTVTYGATSTTNTLSQTSSYHRNATTGLITSVTPAGRNTIFIGRDSSGRVSTVKGYTYTYADSGTTRTTTITGPMSYQRVVVSDLSKLLVQSDTDALSRTTSYTYYPDNNLKRVTQPEGNYVEYEYDPRGNVTKSIYGAKPTSGLPSISVSATYPNPCGSVITCNKPASTTNADSKTTNYTYDPTHGGVLTVEEPAVGGIRPTTTYSYTALYAYYKNSGGSIVAAPAPIYKLTGISRCATTASCAGTADEVKMIISYGATGVANNLLPTAISKGAGNGSLTATTTMTYTSNGDMMTVTDPTSRTTRRHYNAGRQLVGEVSPDPDGPGGLKLRATRYFYGNDGSLVTTEVGVVDGQSDGDWATFSPSYSASTYRDTQGRKIAEWLSSGSTIQSMTQYNLDGAGRVTCVTRRLNPATFDLGTHPCTPSSGGTYGPDQITAYTYDNAGAVTAVTEGYGSGDPTTTSVSSSTYTYNGKLSTVTDGKGNKTTYEYDGFDRLKKTRYPDLVTAGASSNSDFEEVYYDAANGRQNGLRRRDATTASIAYDSLGRVSTTAEGTAVTYDLLSRMKSIAINGRTLSSDYDALGRVTGTTAPQGAVAYQYDLAGRRTRMTWPDNYYVDYSYDGVGQLDQIREYGVTSGLGLLADFTYDNLGRRTQLTRGNGTSTTYGYSAVSDVASLAHNLDGAGTSHDLSVTFSHDPSRRISSRTGSNTLYDPASLTALTRGYSHNALNQMTVSGPQSLTHDARGNTTFDGANTYGYDLQNRLTSIAIGPTLSYDPAGRLHEVTGAATRRFLYDGQDIIGEYNGSNVLVRRYVHGAGVDEPLVWLEGSGTSDRRWLHADDLGSVVAVTNGAGASVATNTYDAFGDPGASNLGRFQYTGQAWFEELRLYHYKARAYSPALGRFLQADPIGYGDGMNMYAYVGNDPINMVDPSGLSRYCFDVPYRYGTSEWAPGGIIATVHTGTTTQCVDVPDYGGGGSIPTGGGGGGGGSTAKPFPPLNPLPSCLAIGPAATALANADFNRRLVEMMNKSMAGTSGVIEYGFMMNVKTGNIGPLFTSNRYDRIFARDYRGSTGAPLPQAPSSFPFTVYPHSHPTDYGQPAPLGTSDRSVADYYGLTVMAVDTYGNVDCYDGRK